MSSEHAIDLIREVLRVTLFMAGPLLGVALVVGLVTGALQTAMQLHEQTLSLVPKLIVVAAAAAATMPWLVGRLLEFTRQVIGDIPSRIG